MRNLRTLSLKSRPALRNVAVHVVVVFVIVVFVIAVFVVVVISLTLRSHPGLRFRVRLRRRE